MSDDDWLTELERVVNDTDWVHKVNCGTCKQVKEVPTIWKYQTLCKDCLEEWRRKYTPKKG